MYDHTYSKSMDQPGKIASPARGQLNRYLTPIHADVFFFIGKQVQQFVSYLARQPTVEFHQNIPFSLVFSSIFRHKKQTKKRLDLKQSAPCRRTSMFTSFNYSSSIHYMLRFDVNLGECIANILKTCKTFTGFRRISG